MRLTLHACAGFEITACCSFEIRDASPARVATIVPLRFERTCAALRAQFALRRSALI